MLAAFIAALICLVVAGVLVSRACRYRSRSDQQSLEVARANQLDFPEVQESLGHRCVLNLDAVCMKLDRDFQKICLLLSHSVGSQSSSSFDEWILRIDYRLARVCFTVFRLVAPQRSLAVLRKMAASVSSLAGEMAERMTSQA